MKSASWRWWSTFADFLGTPFIPPAGFEEPEKNCRELEAKTGQPFEHKEKLRSLCQRQKELEDALDITKNQASNSLAAEEMEVQTVKESEGESIQETPDKISHLKNMIKMREEFSH